MEGINKALTGVFVALITCVGLTISISVPCLAMGNLPQDGSSFSADPTLKDIFKMKDESLDGLYSKSSLNEVPDGYYRGVILRFPGHFMNGFVSRLLSIIWQGMDFEKRNNLVLNRILGIPFLYGILYEDESPSDGKPTTIIDYSETSDRFASRRDEIRRVSDTIFLGKTHTYFAGEYLFRQYYLLIKKK